MQRRPCSAGLWRAFSSRTSENKFKAQQTRTSKGLALRKSSSGSALLIVDMVSDWTFPDAEKILPFTFGVAAKIAIFKCRCQRASVPVIYVNGN